MTPKITATFAAASQLARSIVPTFVLLFFSALSLVVDAATPPLTITPTWVRELGTIGQDVGEGVSADAFGGVYVSGFVSGNLAAPYAGGFSDVFLRKYSSSGNTVWTRQFGTDQDEEGNSTATDSVGNVFVSGWTRGNLAGPNSGAEDAFLAKYDGSGNRLWIRQLGTVSNDLSYGVSTDGFGNAFITGYTNGSFVLPNNDGRDMFVTKYDPAGTLVWTRQFSPNVEQAGFGVSGDSLGNVYVSGYTGNSNIPGGVFDPFVNKYDPAGNLVWTRQLGTTHHAVSSGVSVDNLGDVYIAGSTSINLGGGPILGQDDAFVAKYNPSGDLIWVRQIGTAMNEMTNGVSTDGLGDVFITGFTTGNLAGPITGGNDPFIAEFDSAGNLRALGQLGSDGSDQGYAIAADPFGSAYISGYVSGSVFGNPFAGNIDAFVAKFPGVPEPATWMMMLYGAIISVTTLRRRRLEW